MSILLLIILAVIFYIPGGIASFFYFHKRYMKKFVGHYGFVEEKHTHEVCIIAACIWPLAFVYMFFNFIYNIPADLVKNVEARKEKINK